jgi:hypothetical protein
MYRKPVCHAIKQLTHTNKVVPIPHFFYVVFYLRTNVPKRQLTTNMGLVSPVLNVTGYVKYLVHHGDKLFSRLLALVLPLRLRCCIRVINPVPFFVALDMITLFASSDNVKHETILGRCWSLQTIDICTRIRTFFLLLLPSFLLT